MYQSIFKDEIDRIAEHIRKNATQKTVENLKNTEISRCSISMGGHEGSLRKENKTDTLYILCMSAETKADIVLLTMIHELFHIPFLASKILPPTQWDLDKEHREYLENTIDNLATEFIEKNREWVINKFKEWFNRDYLDFPLPRKVDRRYV
jgi:hypothetical protein